MLMRTAFLGALAALIANPAISATFTAVETASVSRQSGSDIWNDDLVRAYSSTSLDADGWIKFDLSAIADTLSVTKMTLTLFGLGVARDPAQVEVFYNSHDTWSRDGTDFVSPFEQSLTGVDYGPFPMTPGGAHTITLDQTAINWANALVDDTLTLVTVNRFSGYSYTYFHGADTDLAPVLTLHTLAEIPLPETFPMYLGGLFGVFAWIRRRNVPLMRSTQHGLQI